MNNRNEQDCDLKSEQASERSKARRGKKHPKKKIKIITATKEEKSEQIVELNKMIDDNTKAIAAKIGSTMSYKTAPFRIWDRK